MTGGKSVRLFLVDGTPGGLLTAEIMNWTGHVVAAPRSDLGVLLKRPEAGRTGNANLTKAHARYLECRLVSLAQQAGRARLVNGTAPPTPHLPESDVSDMEAFIAEARVVLPVLGVNLFRSTPSTAPTTIIPGHDSADEPVTSPIFQMRVRKEGILATAQEADGEFTVFEASTARSVWKGMDDGYRRLREKLEQDGTLIPSPDGQRRVFSRNQVFASPSAAAGVVAGRSANGRIEWRIQGTSTSYGIWQNQAIETNLGEHES